MAVFSLLRAMFLANFISSIAGSPVGSLTNDLKPLLSSAAEIYYAGSVGFTNATRR